MYSFALIAVSPTPHTQKSENQDIGLLKENILSLYANEQLHCRLSRDFYHSNAKIKVTIGEHSNACPIINL